MIGSAIHLIKILLLYLSDLIHRLEKFARYLVTSKHEFERICEDETDIYEKTFKLDQWLTRTNCDSIRDFWRNNFHLVKDKEEFPPGPAQKIIDRILADYIPGHSQKSEPKPKLRYRKNRKSEKLYQDENVNLEHCDDILKRTLKLLTADLVDRIKRSKGRPKLTAFCEDTLRDSINRIITYRLTLLIAERLASTSYDSNVNSHLEMLVSLWNNLIKSDKSILDDLKSADSYVILPQYRHDITKKTEIVSSRWSNIGFQGEDPGTDFRGMGLLGLEHLTHLSKKPKNLSIDLLKRSLNEQHEYPWAIVGINITYNLLCLFRDGSMKHLYYDEGDPIFRTKGGNLDVMKTFNDIYVELFLRFDCFWHESKPENIFAFKSVIEKFVDVIKTDLCNRNFSFKFIY